MAGYIVRLRDGGEIVGFFTAQTRRGLFWSIDECVDPWACDFKRVGVGGVYWPRPHAPDVECENMADSEIRPTETLAARIADGKAWDRFYGGESGNLYGVQT